MESALIFLIWKQKCNTYECNEHFADFTYVDIFKSISQIKHILQLPNYKQKTIEAFLGIGRDDLYSGGELIEIYHSYTKEPRPDKLEILLLHNYEDVLDMPALLPVLSYVHLFYGQYLSCSASVSEYTDYKQQEKKNWFFLLSRNFHFQSIFPAAWVLFISMQRAKNAPSPSV